MLAHIIEHAGWRNPIVVSKRSGLVTKGHARLLAAMMLGVTEVPVDEQTYKTEADEVADLVADNRLSELSELDYSLVNEIFLDADLFPQTFDLDLTGFDLFSRGDIKKKYHETDETNGETAPGTATDESGDSAAQSQSEAAEAHAESEAVGDGAANPQDTPQTVPAGLMRCPKCGFSWDFNQ